MLQVQALLEGISLSQPQPKLPSELIKFLGKTYNAWHIAIPLLESHVVLFPHVSHATAAAHVCSPFSDQHQNHTAGHYLHNITPVLSLLAKSKAVLS